MSAPLGDGRSKVGYIGNNANRTRSIAITANRQLGMNCLVDDLSKSLGSSTISAFSKAMHAVGATKTSNGTFKLAGKPTTSSAKAFYYTASAKRIDGAVALTLKTQEK